jgi:hypothetical protein
MYFFPKFYMQMNFWMNFFVTCSKKYLNVPQCITFFFVSHYWINMNFLKCAYSLHIQCFILKNDQNFKSSLKIKISHSLILLYYYNFFSYIMYIITHLYVVKDSWSSKILKQFWNILWIFKVLKFHIFKSMNVFWVWLICYRHLYIFQSKLFPSNIVCVHFQTF